VGKIRDTSGFYGSLKLLLQEEEAFAKATGPFDRCVIDLRDYLDTGRLPGEREADGWAQNLMARARGTSRTFAKALATLDVMVKALPAASTKRVVSVETRDPSAEPAATVAKSFDALRNDVNLTPAARGELMLGLSSLAGKVFAKAEGVSGRLEQVRSAIALLDRAKAEHHIAEIDPLVEQIREAVRKGETEPSDLLTIESKLHEIRRHLEEHQDVEKN
jgi:hypothetical protein